jgi:CheY-like chemotaxis protein
MVGKQKVLIADDDRELAKMWQTALTLAGYEVVVVHDGEEAKQLIVGENNFDLILMDVIMPKLDGITLLKAIPSRKIEQLRVVVVTNLYQASVKGKLSGVPIRALVDKSEILPEELVKKVGEWIRN